MAFSDNGCVSQKSEPRAFKYNCSQGGGEGGRSGGQLCDFFNVDMKIVGPAQVKCKDNPSYNIEGSYNKTDASGDIQVELLNYKWELKAPESTIQKGGGCWRWSAHRQQVAGPILLPGLEYLSDATLYHGI